MTLDEYITQHGRSTPVLGPIYNMSSYSNVDYWYGPYNSKEDACSIIPIGLRALGLTVGIIENGKVVEYLWKLENVSNENLEPKIEKNEPVIISNISPYYSLNPGDNFESITVEYSGALKGLVNISRNGSLIETQSLNKGLNIIRLGQYKTNNEYNFTLNFSDIGGNPAEIINNGIILDTNEISFRLSVGTITIEDEFLKFVNTRIINSNSNITFPFKVSYINSLVLLYTLTAILDNGSENSINLGTATYNSKLLNTLNFTLPNISVGEHTLLLVILDTDNIYNSFSKEYLFTVVDVNTRIIRINILNLNEIYSGKSIVFNALIFSGTLVSNVKLSYSYASNGPWIDLNSTINLNEIKLYSINAPTTLSVDGELKTLYVKWNNENVITLENFVVQPYHINVSTNGLEYYYNAEGNNATSDTNWEWENSGSESTPVIINKISENSFLTLENNDHILRFEGNFGVIKENIFKNIHSMNKGFTLELKYDTECIGDLSALVFKNEFILVSYNKIKVSIGGFLLTLSVSENRKIHLAWVIDYDEDRLPSSIEDFLDFPISNIYINGSLCSAIPLGNKSTNTPLDILSNLSSLYSSGSYFNCGSLTNLNSDEDYILKALEYEILSLNGNNWGYDTYNNLGQTAQTIINNLNNFSTPERNLLLEIKNKVDIILNSQNIGVSNINLFRFYSRPLKASEIYTNYQSDNLSNINNETVVPIVVFTTFDSDTLLHIINDLNNKDILGDGKRYEFLPGGFSDLQKMGQGEKSKQKTHFVYGRLLYYENGFTENGTPTLSFYTMTSTQGTSSLLYPVKNFKTTLCKYDTTNRVFETKEKNGKYKLSKNKSNFGQEGWQEESKFTLKCDYMESAHFNNTPTCSFYNDIIDSTNLFYEVDESTGNITNKYNPDLEISQDKVFEFPSPYKSLARLHDRYDAIKGFPCVVYTLNSDPDNSEIKNACNNDAYLGTYMFNLDKSADSLGFDYKDPDILTKYDEFPQDGVDIAERFIHEVDGETRLFLAKEAMSTFDISKCVDITDYTLTQSYEGKANVRYSSGTFYSHSEYSGFGYREYILNVINILNSISPDNDNIIISEQESGYLPDDFYALSKILDFLEEHLGADSLSAPASLSSDPIYYIGDKDNNYYLDTSDITQTYTAVYLYNRAKWQQEDSEAVYFSLDYETRWDYLEELEDLGDLFKDSNDKIDWHHIWGDGKTWGWKRVVDWVGNTFSVDKTTTDFKKYFNLNYCLLYYLQMIVFGQVDNAGKNCMWDTWDGKIWFPRPYDLDSAIGLNNSGYENVPTYAELARELSPLAISDNRGLVYTNTDNTDVRYKLYTTSTSKFWNTFGKVYNTEISNMYALLRSGGIYNLDTILNYYTSLTSKKLSPDFYNKDMVIKYIINYPNSSDYYTRIHGNRIESFYQWMKERLVFCDSLYGYDRFKSLNFRLSSSASSTTLSFEVYYPQYIHIAIGTNQQIINLFCCPESKYKIEGITKNGSAFSTNVIANDKETDIYGGDNIKIINGLQSLLDSVTFDNAEKLIELNASGSNNIESISLNNCKFLQKLDLSNCSKLKASPINLSNSKYLKEVNFSGCTSNNFVSVVFPTNNNLKSINFKNSSILLITLNNALNLENFNIENCENLSQLTLINSNVSSLNLDGYNLTNLNLLNCFNLTEVNCDNTKYIGLFSLSNCNALDKITFKGSSSPILLEISLTGAPNLKHIDFNGSTSLKKLRLDNTTFPTIFDITNSSIELLNYGEYFDTNPPPYVDCSNLSEVSNLSFRLCKKIQHIKNLGTDSSYYDVLSTTNMFDGCEILEDLSNCYLSLKGSCGNYIFKNCYLLNDFINCQFNLDECVSFLGAFTSCNALPWEIIKLAFMDKLNDTDNINISLLGMFTYKKSVEDNLPDGFFGKCANVNNINSIFIAPGGKSILSITKAKFYKNGSAIKMSKITSMNQCFYSNYNLTTIDSDLITKIFENVQTMFATFIGCSRLTIPDPNIFFHNLAELTDITGVFNSAGSSSTNNLITYTFDSTSEGFLGCTKLTTIGEAFRGCSNLLFNIESSIFPKSVTIADNVFNGMKISFTNNYSGDIFEEPTDSKKNVYVGGMFGDTNLNYIPLNLFINIKPISNIRNTSTILLGRTYGGSATNVLYSGVFEHNPNLTLGSTTISSILSKFIQSETTASFSRLFKDCSSLIIYSLDFSGCDRIINLSSMFENCSNLGINSITNVPNSIRDIRYMFSKANINSLTSTSVKNLISNKPNLTNLDYVFLGDPAALSNGLLYKLDGTEFEGDTSLLTVSGAFKYSLLYGNKVPAKLFDYCRLSLLAVDNLFDHCTYLGLTIEDLASLNGGGETITDSSFESTFLTIEDSVTYTAEDYEVVLGIRNIGDIKGLLSDCTRLVNTSNMFSWCYNLGGKIPSTIFVTNDGNYYTHITNMSQMFYNTNFNDGYAIDGNNENKLLVANNTFYKIQGNGSSNINLSGMFAGVGSRYIGNFSNTGKSSKCLSFDNEGKKLGVKFILNLTLFPNAKKVNNLSYMFTNSSIENVDGAFSDGDLVYDVTNIYRMFAYSRIKTVSNTNFMIGPISESNNAINKNGIGFIFYCCSELASNPNATIPDFGSNTYSKVPTTAGTSCYLIKTGMNISGNTVSGIASANVVEVLKSNPSAFNNTTNMGFSDGTSYPISCI